MKRDITQKLRHIGMRPETWERMRLRLLYAQLTARIHQTQNQLKGLHAHRVNVGRKLEALETHPLPFEEAIP